MVSGKNTVFWCVMYCVVGINDVSEEPAVPYYSRRFCHNVVIPLNVVPITWII